MENGRSKIEKEKEGESMKKLTCVLLLLALIAVSYGCTEYQARGAGVGGVLGGIAGAFLDSRNPWRGGVIGGALGALAGATIADVSAQANQQAVATGQPVQYQTDNGQGVYRAEPESRVYYPDEHTRCRKVRERVWDHGQLVKDRVKEVCTSVSERPGY